MEIRRLEHVIFIRILLFPAETQRLVWSLDVRRLDAELLHVMARSAKKGRRAAKDAEDAEMR